MSRLTLRAGGAGDGGDGDRRAGGTGGFTAAATPSTRSASTRAHQRLTGVADEVRVDTPAIKLAENAGHPVERLRQDLRDAIAMHVPDTAAAGVLAALAIGDQAAIDWFASKLSWS